MKEIKTRLESLDILRGFDLFCLIALQVILVRATPAVDSEWYNAIMVQFDHVKWEGFACWDLVMPLFMFMSGITIPFAMQKYIDGRESKTLAYKRIIKRVVVLWLLGMIVQGNLLGFQFRDFRFFSNTLQAIAVGYLIASVTFLNTRTRGQIITTAALLLTYWAAMMFITIDGFGGGNFTAEGNLAEYIDSNVLGAFRDGIYYTEDGVMNFDNSYTYTWVLSSLTFGATALTGLLAGVVLKNTETSQMRKAWTLVIIGASMVAAGWLWGLQIPVIKRIWTSSMVLVSSGYCFLLMALFYYVIDVKKRSRGLKWLKIYGTNSIAAYMLGEVVIFSCIGRSLLHGFEQYLGAWYSPLIAISNAAIVFVILLLMKKHNIFLKA